MAKINHLEDVKSQVITENTWYEFDTTDPLIRKATHIRVESDKDFVFGHGSGSVGFSGLADTKYVMEASELRIKAPSGNGDVTISYQRITQVG